MAGGGNTRRGDKGRLRAAVIQAIHRSDAAFLLYLHDGGRNTTRRRWFATITYAHGINLATKVGILVAKVRVLCRELGDVFGLW
jgi:hypothetical protein